jgi:hypothetical protein
MYVGVYVDVYVRTYVCVCLCMYVYVCMSSFLRFEITEVSINRCQSDYGNNPVFHLLFISTYNFAVAMPFSGTGTSPRFGRVY